MASEIQEQRTLVLVSYVLHLAGTIAGVPSIVGLVINYLKRNDCEPDLRTHHRWMIATFWWAILWAVIGAVLILVLVGWIIVFAAWIWYIYRHVRGLLRLLAGQPMPVG